MYTDEGRRDAGLDLSDWHVLSAQSFFLGSYVKSLSSSFFKGRGAEICSLEYRNRVKFKSIVLCMSGDYLVTNDLTNYLTN